MPAESSIQPTSIDSKAARDKAIKDRALQKALQAERENPNLKLIDAKGSLIDPNSPEAATNRDGTPVAKGRRLNAVFIQEAYNEIMADESKAKDVSEFEQATVGEYASAAKTKNSWVNQRASDLQKLRGLTPQQARYDAELEYEQQFMKPQKPSFDDYPERATPSLMPTPAPATGKATVESALRPQTFMGEAERIAEQKRQDEPGAAQVVGSAPFDWTKLKDKLVKSGLTSEQADSLISGYRAVYNKQYQIFKDPKKAWEATVKISDSSNAALKDKSKWTTDPTKVSQEVSLSEALKAQTKAGEGVPTLTEDERLFLNEKIKEDRRIAGLKVDKMTPPPMKVKSPYKGGIDTFRPMTDEELKAWRESEILKLVPIQTYENSDSYGKAIQGLVEWEPGLLEERNNFGGTRETTAGWLLRGAGAAWNAAAGAIIDAAPELTYGFRDTNAEGGPSFAEEMRGKEKKEGKYKDNPVLANIAEGKGFGGEFAEAADTMWGDDTVSKESLLFNLGKTAYVGGAYAGDMLDPTFEMIGAAAVGLKAGYDVSKAAKATGTAMSAADVLKYGAKEAAKDFAREVVFGLGSDVKAFEAGDVRSTITKNLSNELNVQSTIKNAINSGQSVETALKEAGQSDSAFAKAYKEEIKKGSSAGDAYRSVMESDAISKQVDNAIEAIDDMRRGNPPLKAREKDIARQLAVLARDNPGVYNTLKVVDNLKPKGSKLVAYVAELNPKNIEALKARVINDIARKEVYKATANQAGFDNFVQLTKNSFTTKTKAKEILQKAEQSEIGQLAKSLKTSQPKLMEVPVEARAFAKDAAETTKIAPVVDLSKEQSLVVARTLQQLVGLKVFPADSAAMILNLVKTDSVITLRDLRKILDSEIDLIAEAQPTIVRARDMNLLSDPQKTERLLQPLETKHFGSNAFVDFTTKFFNDITGAIKTTTSPSQRTILQQALQKSGNLDATLRTSMSKALSDPDFRKIYGMPVDSQPTRQTALAYLVAGPEVGRSADDIKTVLESTVQSLIFEKSSKEAIFDQVTGAKTFRDNSIYNASGIQQMDSVIDAATKTILNNPSKLWDVMMNVVEFAENLSKDATYLKNAVDPTKVTRITEDVAKKTGRKAIPSEVQVGAFYRAEMSRIAKESLQEIVSGTAKTATPNIEQSISGSARVVLKNIADAEAARIRELSTDLLLEQGAVTRLKGTLAEQTAEGKVLRQESKTLGQAIKQEKKELNLTAKQKREEIATLLDEEDSRLKLLGQKEERILLKAQTKAEKQKIKEEVSRIRENLKKTFAQKRAEVAAGITQRKETREAIKSATENVLATKYKIKQEDISRMEKVIAGQDIKADLMGDLITSRLAKNVSGEDIGKYADMPIKDIIKDLPDSWKTSAAITKDELMEIIISADEVAKTIQIANKIPTNGSIDDISKQIAKYFQDPKLEDQVKLLFGEDIYKQINAEIGEGGSRLNKSLEDLVAREYGPNQHIIKKVLYDANDILQEIFYTLTLTAAPRFHFGNIFGAPGILYKTLGDTGIRALNKVPASSKLMYDAKASAKNLSKIIVSDPSGRAYTAGEVFQMLSEIGTQSQFSRGGTNVAKDMVSIIEDASKNTRFARAIQRSAEAEDMVFRGAVLLKALEDGRGVDEAIKLSRASLYDVGDIGKIIKAEKAANNYLLFYNFARNNVINTLELLTSAKGQSRIQKYSKFVRAVEGTPIGDKESISTKEKAMMSEYAQSRIILDTLDIGKDKYALAFAPDAMLDGLNFLTAVVEGGLKDKLSGMIRPIIKEKEEKEPSKIDPEFASIINVLPEKARDAMLYILTGSKDINPQVIETEGKNIEIVYPLDLPSQRSRYSNVKDFLNFIGLSRIVSDYGKTFGVAGTATEKAGMGVIGKAAYTTALATPLKIANEERVALYNTLSQTAEGKKFVKDTEKLASQTEKIASEEESNIVKIRQQNVARTVQRIPKTKREIYNARDNYDKYLDNLYESKKINLKQMKEMRQNFINNDFIEPQSNVNISGVKYQE